MRAIPSTPIKMAIALDVNIPAIIFVIIFCDDLGYGDIASFGNPIIRTPNLDLMANEGQKWTQFYDGTTK